MPSSRITKIVSYNLKLHKAYPEIAGLVVKHKVDLVCLQECGPQLEPNIAGLTLAGSTKMGRVGQAIYYHPEKFDVESTQAYALFPALYEKLLPSERNRLFASRLCDKKSGRRLTVASVHAVHLVALNATRRRQIGNAIDMLDDEVQTPTVILGDYNYPFFPKKLIGSLGERDYNLQFGDKQTYKRGLFKGSFDAVAYRGISGVTVTTLPFGLSDHAPILVELLH